MKKVWEVICRFFGWARHAPVPIIPGPIDEAPQAPRRKPSATAPLVRAGDFSQMLDGLPKYFAAMRAMKARDPDAYDLFSKVGGVLVPDQMMFHETDYLDVFRHNTYRPSFGMTFIQPDESDDKKMVLPRLFFFKKMDRHADLQPTNGEIYEVGLVFQMAKGSKCFVAHAHVSVDDAGSVVALKSRIAQPVTLPRSRSRRGGSSTTFSVNLWAFPLAFQHMYRDKKGDPGLREGVDGPGSLIALAFCDLASIYLYATNGVRVRVEKGNLAATMFVPMDKTAEFFRKRDRADGRRIFHSVKSHEREGSAKGVRMHFRGLRKFEWGDYRVSLTVPGYDHADERELRAKSVSVDGPDIPPGMMDMAAFGSAMAKVVKNTRRRGEVLH